MPINAGNRRGPKKWLVPILFFQAISWTTTIAQEFRGSITGIIKDQTGAVIKDAEVVATNLETGNSFKTVSNETGAYLIPLLPIGSYEVGVTAIGFERAAQKFEVHGGDRLQIDLELHPGSTSQTVSVDTTVPLLETMSGAAGLTVASEQVHDLPTIGRNPFTLATIAPGVAIPPGQHPGNSLRPFDNGGFDGMQINGSRTSTTSYLIDGLTNTAIDSTAPASVVFVPSPDMTQEFKVQTTVYDAQYGRTGGGVVSVNLKSGTNAFHGVASYYIRNTVLNANDYADNRAGNQKAAFHWSQPGLVVSGPVYIPKLYDGRNKTFFMFGWEEIRTSSPSPVYVSVPSMLERQGDFSQSQKGAPVTIYDPLTTTQLPDGSYRRTPVDPANPSKIPANRIDPVAKNILALIPLPNLPGNTSNLFVGPNTVSDAYDAFAYRVDQSLSQTQHIFFSYLYSNRHQVQGTNGFPVAITPSYLHHRTNFGAHIDWSWIISPSLVSSFRVGWNEHRFAIVNQQDSFDLSSIGLPSYFQNSPAPNLFPQITMTNYTTFGNAGGGTGRLNTSDNYDLTETLIKSLNRHDLSFGGEIRPMRDDRNFVAGNSTFGFGTDFTQANPLAPDNRSGNAFASFLLGYPDTGAASSAPKPAYRNYYYALFLQDNWHPTDRLTVTLGLRWDTETPQIDSHHQINTGFDPSASYAFAGQNLKGQVQFPDNGRHSAYNQDLNNFGPRFGLSYRMTQKAVLRGGFGILYSPTFDLPTQVGFGVSTPYVASNNNLLTPAHSLSNPYPDGFLQPAGSNTNLNGQGGWTFWNNRTRNIPRTTQFSFGVEYQFPSQALLDVRYVGQLTANLPNTRNANFLPVQYLSLGNALNAQVPNPFAGQLPGTPLNSATISRQQSLLNYPQYTNFNEIFTNGTTTYNGLQVRLEKRLSHGLHLLGSYTYSKSMVTGYLNDQDTALRSWIDQYSIPHIITISGGYALPFFKDSPNRFAKQTLGGWALNVIYTYSSGHLYAAPTGVQSTGINPNITRPTPSHQFNTCTITVSGTLQNCAAGEQPAWAINKPFTLNQTTPYFGGFRSAIPQNVNLSVFKSFPLYEQMKLQFRAEAFNFTNTPQFGAPDTGVNSPTFGALTNFAQQNDPRAIQLALRLSF